MSNMVLLVRPTFYLLLLETLRIRHVTNQPFILHKQLKRKVNEEEGKRYQGQKNQHNNHGRSRGRKLLVLVEFSSCGRAQKTKASHQIAPCQNLKSAVQRHLSRTKCKALNLNRVVEISVVRQVFLESKACDIRGIVRLSLMITFFCIVPPVLDGIFEVHCACLCRGNVLTVKNHGPIMIKLYP